MVWPVWMPAPPPRAALEFSTASNCMVSVSPTRNHGHLPNRGSTGASREGPVDVTAIFIKHLSVSRYKAAGTTAGLAIVRGKGASGKRPGYRFSLRSPVPGAPRDACGFPTRSVQGTPPVPSARQAPVVSLREALPALHRTRASPMREIMRQSAASRSGLLHNTSAASHSRLHLLCPFPRPRSRGKRRGSRIRALRIRRRILLRVLSWVHIHQVQFHLRMA